MLRPSLTALSAVGSCRKAIALGQFGVPAVALGSHATVVPWAYAPVRSTTANRATKGGEVDDSTGHVIMLPTKPLPTTTAMCLLVLLPLLSVAAMVPIATARP